MAGEQNVAPRGIAIPSMFSLIISMVFSSPLEFPFVATVMR